MRFLVFRTRCGCLFFDRREGAPSAGASSNCDENCFGFHSKTPFEGSRQGLQKCSGVIKKMMLANTNLDEMLKDPYCFNRIHVRRYLVRFFKIPKDSHHPWMQMSSCASRGYENH